MPFHSRFNVRVYGICMENGAILLSREIIRGSAIIKFPGGGLEYGEGTIDCLIREMKEELNTSITNIRHFYTTDFFQPSAFDDSQVISIYYLFDRLQPHTDIRNNETREHSFWLPMHNVNQDTFTLPIDKKIGAFLQNDFKGAPADG